MRLGQQDAAVIMQDVLSEAFPIIEPVLELGVQVSFGPSAAPEGSQFGATSAWRFQSTDRKWRLNISTNAMSLETIAYVDSEDFQRRFKPALDMLPAHFGSPMITRTGLRKVNLFPKDVIESTEALRVEAMPLLVSELAPAIASARSQLVLRAQPGGANVAFGVEPDSAFRLDIDRYDETEMDLQTAVGLIPALSEDVTSLFRWLISPKLAAHMVPEQK